MAIPLDIGHTAQKNPIFTGIVPRALQSAEVDEKCKFQIFCKNRKNGDFCYQVFSPDFLFMVAK